MTAPSSVLGEGREGRQGRGVWRPAPVFAVATPKVPNGILRRLLILEAVTMSVVWTIAFLVALEPVWPDSIFATGAGLALTIVVLTVSGLADGGGAAAVPLARERAALRDGRAPGAAGRHLDDRSGGSAGSPVAASVEHTGDRGWGRPVHRPGRRPRRVRLVAHRAAPDGGHRPPGGARRARPRRPPRSSTSWPATPRSAIGRSGSWARRARCRPSATSSPSFPGWASWPRRRRRCARRGPHGAIIAANGRPLGPAQRGSCASSTRAGDPRPPLQRARRGSAIAGSGSCRWPTSPSSTSSRPPLSAVALAVKRAIDIVGALTGPDPHAARSCWWRPSW